MRTISRSSIQLYQHCPRAHYHKYFDPAGGPGIEPTDRPEYYSLGISFHEAGERLLDPEVPAPTAAAFGIEDARKRGLSERWQNWILAACIAWDRTEREEFEASYDVLGVEEEIRVPITREVELYGRADAVLRDRSTGALYVWNWKTTSDLRDWNKKFHFDIQSWTEAIAVGARYGEMVDGVLYGGVWKGPMYKGFTTSRLVGGYKSGDGKTWSPNRGKGLTTKFNAWEEQFPFGAGLAAWVSWLPTELVRSHFAISTPQSIGGDQVEAWVRGIARRESDIAHIVESGDETDVLDFFTQNCDDRCEKCPYLDICAGRANAESLLADGLMKKRDDSHLKEKEEKTNG